MPTAYNAAVAMPQTSPVQSPFSPRPFGGEFVSAGDGAAKRFFDLCQGLGLFAYACGPAGLPRLLPLPSFGEACRLLDQSYQSLAGGAGEPVIAEAFLAKTPERVYAFFTRSGHMVASAPKSQAHAFPEFAESIRSAAGWYGGASEDDAVGGFVLLRLDKADPLIAFEDAQGDLPTLAERCAGFDAILLDSGYAFAPFKEIWFPESPCPPARLEEFVFASDYQDSLRKLCCEFEKFLLQSQNAALAPQSPGRKLAI